MTALAVFGLCSGSGGDASNGRRRERQGRGKLELGEQECERYGVVEYKKIRCSGWEGLRSTWVGPMHMEMDISMFVWLWLVVNDRKFSAGTIFFSHTNQPAVLLNEPATIRTSQPNRLHVDGIQSTRSLNFQLRAPELAFLALCRSGSKYDRY